MKKNPAFHRTELLIGEDAVTQLAKTRVILFGVGGVGSWCAEALIRSGIGHLTLVDNDVICVTNINRQLQATTENIGESKVEALKKRLVEIHPEADIKTFQSVYTQGTCAEFNLESYDYVVDAIDSLSHKVDLMASVMRLGVTLFSAMGAACKLDATTIQVDSIWETRGCKLAKMVRKRLRHYGVTGDCLCVYSQEFMPPQFESKAVRESVQRDGPDQLDDERNEISAAGECDQKVQTKGSMVHMTGIFGFHLAGLVVQDVVRSTTLL